MLSFPDIRGHHLYDELNEVDDLLNSPKHKYLSLENFTDSRAWYSEKRTKNFTYTNGTEFTHDYSQLYTMEICEDELEFTSLYDKLIAGAPKQYDPQHLIFISVCCLRLLYFLYLYFAFNFFLFSSILIASSILVASLISRL